MVLFCAYCNTFDNYSNAVGSTYGVAEVSTAHLNSCSGLVFGQALLAVCSTFGLVLIGHCAGCVTLTGRVLVDTLLKTNEVALPFVLESGSKDRRGLKQERTKRQDRH